MNLVMGLVEETKRTPGQPQEKPTVRAFDMLFVRGDSIIMAAPPSRFAAH